MKKILFFALVVVLGLQNVNAQRKKDGGKSPEQMVERLDKKLNLTDEQEKQVAELYKEFFSQKISREDRKAKMEELDSKISLLLNEEQKSELEKMKKSQKN